jgi:hypothetical protein
MKRIFVLLLVLMITLLVAIPVYAAPPEIITGGYVDDYVSPTIICPGIEVRNHEVITYRLMLFFDEAGTWFKAESHFMGTDNYYTPSNPDLVLSGSFTAMYHWDARTGLESWTGVPYHITVPGLGTVMVRAGRFTGSQDHLAGKDSLLSPKDLEQFCSCLAGD